MGGGPAKHAHPAHRHWPWDDGARKGFDWKAIRRGRQVYTEVFAPCHSLKPLNFNHFQAFMTKEEIRKLAESYDLVDPDPDPKDGTPVVRPGKPTDNLPEPYPNLIAAASANNGAAPPNLLLAPYSLEGGADYIFALLTGYKWGEYMAIPPWIKLKPGQFWNPYFKGGVLAMPPPLSDGLLEFEDGTPATVSQMAKDVVCFLRWTSEPSYDERRFFFWRAMGTLAVFHLGIIHYKERQNSWRLFRRETYRYWKKPY
jgi:ubiquinol-cytochrome c reductase cytochrome c1 subunit